MKDNIDYSKFDIKEGIEQALYHSSNISNSFDGSIDQIFFSESHMSNVMHSMWLENQKIKHQLNILKNKLTIIL